MDNVRAFKEKVVNDYLSQIDYQTIDVNQIQEDLQRLLGEKPAIQLNYKQDTLLTEDGSKPKKLEKLESITVVFTYETLVGNQSVPVPVRETFIVG